MLESILDNRSLTFRKITELGRRFREAQAPERICWPYGAIGLNMGKPYAYLLDPYSLGLSRRVVSIGAAATGVSAHYASLIGAKDQLAAVWLDLELP